MEDKERLTVVLRHLIEHNEGHEEDYKRWVDLARGSGMDKVAALIEEANGRAGEASAALKKALALMEE
jgi:nickel/cobalt transporter (NicO) family protein